MGEEHFYEEFSSLVPFHVRIGKFANSIVFPSLFRVLRADGSSNGVVLEAALSSAMFFIFLVVISFYTTDIYRLRPGNSALKHSSCSTSAHCTPLIKPM